MKKKLLYFIFYYAFIGCSIDSDQTTDQEIEVRKTTVVKEMSLDRSVQDSTLYLIREIADSTIFDISNELNKKKEEFLIIKDVEVIELISKIQDRFESSEFMISGPPILEILVRNEKTNQFDLSYFVTENGEGYVIYYFYGEFHGVSISQEEFEKISQAFHSSDSISNGS